MAKIISPLYSITASGKFVDDVTFSRRKGYNLCRWQKTQKDAKTPLQQNQRQDFLNAHLLAHARDFGNCTFAYSLFGIYPSGFESKAEGKKMSWYNYLIKEILKCP